MNEVDPVEEYLRPGRRRRAVAATIVGLLGLTAAAAGWTQLEVPPSAPPVVVPVPVVQVPDVPPPPTTPAKAQPKPRAPRPVLATTSAPEPTDRGREAPPTATLRVKPVE